MGMSIFNNLYSPIFNIIKTTETILCKNLRVFGKKNNDNSTVNKTDSLARVIIFDYAADRNAGQLLAKKGTYQGKEVIYVDLTKGPVDINKLNLSKNDHCKVYVVGHSTEGLTSLFSKEQFDNTTARISSAEVADLIKAIPGSEGIHKISVVACYGGSKGIFGQSFGESISKELYDRGIECPVTARTCALMVVEGKDGKIRKFPSINEDFAQHKAPRTKLIFTTNDGITRSEYT